MGMKDFMKDCFQNLVASCICLCLTIISLAVFAVFGWMIAMIVIGVIYVTQCPIEPMIPIYLIVNGTVSLAVGLFDGVVSIDKEDSAGERKLRLQVLMHLLKWPIHIFLLVWAIVGCVWVLGEYSMVEYGPAFLTDGTKNPNYCDNRLYKFAFASVIIEIGLIGCFSLFVLVVFAIACATWFSFWMQDDVAV